MPCDPDKKFRENRKRRREWLLIGFTTLLVIVFSKFETQLFQFSSQVPLAKSLLVLALINLNILLIILTLFLVFRNVFKLILERRREVPGARLRTRLVVAFVTLSLVPTLLLFFVAAGFVSSSIENWFNIQIETSLHESLEVAQTYYKNSGANALYYGDQLARFIKDQKLLNESNLPQLRDLIQAKQQEYNLGVVEVFSSTYEELVRAANPQIPISEFTDPGSDTIREALQGNRFTRVTPIGKADLIRGVVPVYSNWNPEDVVGVVVVNYYVPYSLVNKMKEISASFEQYKTTKLLKDRIQKGYVQVLLITALAIIFLATWFGFYLARTITVPIQELVSATKRIAGGDLTVQISPQSDDEIALLVEAFNKMTADLRKSQAGISDANRHLRASNQELDQRRRYMEIVLKNVTAGVISVDRQGRITTINKSAEKLLKIMPGKVLGQHFRQVLQAEHLVIINDLLRQLAKSGKDSIHKQMTIPLEDNKLTLLLNLTTLRDENGEFMGTVVVFDDLTHMIKAQRMAAWREVARRIAHEIKNPLTPIRLSAQRLRRRYLDRFPEDDKVFDDCTCMIIKQVDELKILVDEFSNFAKMPSANPAPNNLNEIINETLILYQEAHRHVVFSFMPDSTVPIFNLDRDQIKRSMINMLENAVGAIEKEGHISLETHFNRDMQMVSVIIADDGCGIPSEDKPRLFEPYFSTKKSGTGLGLAIVATIIADHNGYIRVKDNHPKGTKFIIELPTTGRNDENVA
ncbi:MAG: ATP-binding protein [Syntrophotalea acetylenica]|jgi:two-component system nitrogen regulation sensor histidine kinase NtrY|uniref:histidine kinase n=1 Tax=Syntrophotalea acetylenica TaxID=29542 RepID=A0A1L3GK47_SYNAC|nr:ATP-binding protein [Syntrophotalea acetylenica]APG26294.1 PAS domain-containing sensor histidine kinase [Syntrophotalea acetylenica]APG45282.1 PAS domain-containing sensor histidine kinase [Syntrophotalea acetylenica]MDD4457281.1 ATP-binding protein [Syntrophotalea acetylenica]